MKYDDEVALIEEAIEESMDCSLEGARNFLKSDSGCYVSIDGESIWMSGVLIRSLMWDLLRKVQ